MNNYEKIKNMSIKEMAKWLYQFNEDSLCQYCYGCDKDIEELGCEECFKQWLETDVNNEI